MGHHDNFDEFLHRSKTPEQDAYLQALPALSVRIGLVVEQAINEFGRGQQEISGLRTSVEASEVAIGRAAPLWQREVHRLHGHARRA